MNDALPGTAGRVLLVEDHPLLGPVIVQSLVAAGFEVTVARNYEAAVAQLDGGLRPALLLADVKIPGRANGLCLARWARTRFPDMAIVLQTGFLDESMADFDVLLKPFDTEMLLAAIHNAWPKAGGGPDAAGVD